MEMFLVSKQSLWHKDLFERALCVTSAFKYYLFSEGTSLLATRPVITHLMGRPWGSSRRRECGKGTGALPAPQGTMEPTWQQALHPPPQLSQLPRQSSVGTRCHQGAGLQRVPALASSSEHTCGRNSSTQSESKMKDCSWSLSRLQ